MGVIVLTWSVAGLALESPARLAPLGLPLVISRPELLPAGLAVAALYAAARYHYYALMLGTSPFRVRRDLLDKLWAEGQYRPGKARTYWGPIKFASSRSYSHRDEAQRLADSIIPAYPKFARARVKASTRGESQIDQDGEEYTAWHVDVQIPVRCRVAAFLEDLDYSAPVWFSLLAVAIYAARTFR